MKAMGKLRTRLSIGSWSAPFARKNSVGRISIRNSSATGAAIQKETSSDRNTSVGQASPSIFSNTTLQNNPLTSGLAALAAIITRETEKLDKYIKESGVPVPSFDIDAPLDFPKLPKDIKKAREEVLRATKELGDLVTGPRESIRWMAWDVSTPILYSDLRC
jgi:hypothetical protein